MTRAILVGLVACGSLLGTSCDRKAAPLPPPPVPIVVLGEHDEAVPEPETPWPPIPFPPEPLARWGDSRLRHEYHIESIALRPDGKAVAAGAAERPTICLWDTASGRLIRKIRIPEPNKPQSEEARSDGVINFTPDGRRLIAYRRHDLLIYDPETGDLLAEIARNCWARTAITADSKLIASNPNPERLTFWSVETGKVVREVDLLPVELRKPRQRCAFWGLSPDETRAVCSYPDPQDAQGNGGEVGIVYLDGSKPPSVIFSFDKDQGSPRGLYWMSSDRLAIELSKDVFVINPENGQEITRVARRQPEGTLGRIHLTAEGRCFATVGYPIEVIEIDPVTLNRSPRRGVYTDSLKACTTPDGKLLAVPWGHSVRLYDTATWKPLHPELNEPPAGAPEYLRFSPDGQRLLESDYDEIRTRDSTTGNLMVRMRDGDKIYRREFQGIHGTPGTRSATSKVVFSIPDGKWVAGIDTRTGARLIAVWDSKTGEMVFREPPLGDLGSTIIGFDPAGRLWVFHEKDGEVVSLEIPSGRVVEKIEGFPETHDARLSPDGSRLVVSGKAALAVRTTFPPSSWRIIEKRDVVQTSRGPEYLHDPCPQPIGFTPDNRRLVTVSHKGELVVWDLAGPPTAVARRPDPASDWINRMMRTWTISPDGRRLISAESYPERWAGLQVVETATLGEIGRFEPPPGWARMALSPDGNRLILAHWDTTYSVWDWETILASARRPLEEGQASPEKLWVSLASPSAKVGLAAVDYLVDHPEIAVPLLQARLHHIDRSRASTLMQDLGHRDFATREKAERELIAMGSEVEHLVGAALKSPSPEVTSRARRILGKLRKTSPVRSIRAVEILERVGSPPARGLLKSWAKVESLLGREANLALGRVKAD